MKQNILFESYPNFTGSSYELYLELKRLGYEEKYNLIWAVEKGVNHSEIKTVEFFGADKKIQNNILKNTKLIIDSNRYIHKLKHNFRIYVRHGGTFKKCTKYYSTIGDVDAIITTSDDMKAVEQKVWPSYVKNKFIITGMPGTDRLFIKSDIYSNGFIKELTGTNEKFNKIIGWLPTYRQHRHSSTNSGFTQQFGLPIIKDVSDLQEINEQLITNNVLLIIQLHPVQYKNYNTLPKYSNICLVTEEIKNKYNITTMDLMNNFDGLITDYSAAYNEFLLTNKPIALTIEDLPEYAKTTGFSFNYIEWVKGFYVIDKIGLKNYINEIIIGKDSYKEIRYESLKKFHKFIDGKSTERTINYLINAGVLK